MTMGVGVWEGGVNCLGGVHGTAVHTSNLSRHMGPPYQGSVLLFLKVARDENTVQRWRRKFLHV